MSINAMIKSTKQFIRIDQAPKNSNFGENTVQINKWNRKLIQEPIKFVAPIE